VTSSEARAEKPSRRIFDEALRRARVDAAEAVHVGDQPTTDIDGALGAGLAAVLIDRDGNHPGFRRCPRIVSLFELPGVLDAIT
jgi:putative hydrolase of the HAD superfamily